MTFDLNKFKSKLAIELVVDDEACAKDATIPTTRAVVPERIARRRKRFVKLPWTWIERLDKAKSTTTHRLAYRLLNLNFQSHGAPFKLPNGMLGIDGITRFAKYRALRELEELGLIVVERRPKRSPIIRLLP